MWRTPRNAITPWLFLLAGACMIAAGFIRPEETWVQWVMIIAGILFVVNALLQFVLRKRESDHGSSYDRDVR